MLRLKPASIGLKIPHPESPKRYLAEKGENIRMNSYWIRRVNDGEAIIVLK